MIYKRGSNKTFSLFIALNKSLPSYYQSESFFYIFKTEGSLKQSFKLNPCDAKLRERNEPVEKHVPRLVLILTDITEILVLVLILQRLQ